MVFSDDVRSTLAAVAEASLPAGSRLPAGGERTIRRLELTAGLMPARFGVGLSALAKLADGLALRCGKRSLSSVPVNRRFDLLESWKMAGAYPVRLAFHTLLTALKAAHYDDPEVCARSGCRFSSEHFAEEAPPRWMAQVVDLSSCDPDQEVEADVVIVGSGAGGGAAARTLAARGLAVVILESGVFHGRNDFTGPVFDRTARLYSAGGMQFTVGNVSIFLPTGTGVGGTTTINEGTCLRVPPWVLRSWRDRLGVPVGETELDPWFAQVEGWLEVALPDAKGLGVPAQIAARGAAALGLSHGPLPRNAPGCDAQGICAFGCPTGAKRSTDVSLIPAALNSGAMLFTQATVTGIDRTRGLPRVAAAAPTGRKLTVRARSVILAAGSLRTPALLRQAGIEHPELGRQLSIHPALGAVGLFPFEVAQDEAIPQGYGVEGLREQGILFEGASTPFALTALALNHHGPRLVELLEQHRRLLTFGFSIRDTSRGRVVSGPGGEPLVLYRLGAADVAQMQFGLRVLVDLLAGGGATEVFPPLWFSSGVPGHLGSRTLDGRTLAATDFDSLSAYHPLGTTRMGVDPRRSVVDMDLKVRGAPELMVCDGGVIPSSMGVNPQLTIMALTARASEALADRLGS